MRNAKSHFFLAIRATEHREIKAWICKHWHSSASTNSPAGCTYVWNCSIQTRCLLHTVAPGAESGAVTSKLQTASDVIVPWARRSTVPWGILLGPPEAHAARFQIWLWGTLQGCPKQQGNREARPVSWNKGNINCSFAPTGGKKWMAVEAAKCTPTSGKQSYAKFSLSVIHVFLFFFSSFQWGWQQWRAGE